MGAGMKKRLLLAFGTRPEAIKMAPVIQALRAHADRFEVFCCVTAQHRAMLDQVLDTFAIVPDFDLDVMRAGQDLTDVHSAVLTGMRAVLVKARPALVLVHGDTTTTLATVLAAFYAGIPVGHIEAGLRSGRIDAPYPEEMNRRVASMIARYHFAPTPASAANLLREGVDAASIVVTGNTVVDALRACVSRFDTDPPWRSAIETRLARTLGFDWRAERYVVVTCHRRENLGDGIGRICDSLVRLATRHPDVRFVVPSHPNPAVRGPVASRLKAAANIHVVDPMPYPDFLQLLCRCYCVMTDSGGLQEEAAALGKPALVLRDVTERHEAVDCGVVRLVGTDPGRIIAEASRLLEDEALYRRMATAGNPFGDGMAGERIAAFLKAL